MTDVARAVGVSHQTVSRVLNDHPNVRPETRERVLEAIKSLGYRRNSAARALVTRHSGMLGVVCFDTTLYGPASTVYGIEQAARAAGYFISIVSLKEITRANVQEAIDHLADQGVDGIIVVAPQRSAAQAIADIPDGIPVVAVEGGHAPGASVVCVDQVAGATAVVEHLLELGHETVWHVAGPPDWLEAEARLLGWREVLEAAGRAAPKPLPGDWSPRSGYEAGRQLLRMPDVTAVFVANDQMALGVLRAFAEAGRDIPGEVSIAGFDDIPESEFFSPPLTTVRQDFAKVGSRSLDVLLRQMDSSGSADLERVVVPPEFVQRESTAGPPGP
ncbi:LacI family DNA-binding transcriptional regulator [Phytoactinopolyspora mesophila]|uniref:Substrate-binding domain-containing protein n=1 Tax=Phytoactinopolyspora mesophila TaxID=2650750 RepID=A0A7K3M9F7_9ACTN|nr:LacI family DNA-binding transcriptional regulator [Phytoactinopolyspora mesophila]NDL59981.1 substrate-binding domain-containing protein [Phytoactinopolyspora mesophila]